MVALFLIAYVAIKSLFLPIDFSQWFLVAPLVIVSILYREKVIPAMLAAVFTKFLILDAFSLISPMLIFLTSLFVVLTPILGVKLLAIAKVENFRKLSDVDFRHVIFIIIFTSAIFAISSFTLYSSYGLIQMNEFDYLFKLLLGNAVFGTLLVYGFIKFISISYIANYLNR